LVGELLLTQTIQTEELDRKWLEVLITDGGQLDLHDNLSIWHHHSNISEEHLEILWELLTTGITGVHGDEVTDLWFETDVVDLTWERELPETESLGLGDGQDLHSNDRQHIQMDSVELIEATPQTRLTKTLEDLGHIDVGLLWGTVGDDDEDTEGSTHIFHSLSLTSTSWSSWSTTEVHVQSLSQGDVASISQWSDTETFFGSKELIGIVDLPVGDLDTEMFSFFHPVDSDLSLPVEVINIRDLGQILREEVQVMDLDGNQGLDLDTVELGSTLLETHNTQIILQDEVS